MKKFKKYTSIAILGIIMFAFTGNAIGQIHVGATIGAQVPIGDFGNYLHTGFGFNATGKYMVKDNIAIGLNVGYNKFGAEISGINAAMIPFTLLGEYQFEYEKFKPYLGADLGLYNYRVKVISPFFGETTNSKTYFGFAPTAGVLYAINDKLSLCGNLKFHYVVFQEAHASWLGINAGIVYKIK